MILPIILLLLLTFTTALPLPSALPQPNTPHLPRDTTPTCTSARNSPSTNDIISTINAPNPCTFPTSNSACKNIITTNNIVISACSTTTTLSCEQVTGAVQSIVDTCGKIFNDGSGKGVRRAAGQAVVEGVEVFLDLKVGSV